MKKVILFGSIGLLAVGTTFHLMGKKDGKCPLGRLLHPTHAEAVK